MNIFGPRLFLVKFLKEAWDQQSLIDKQDFGISNSSSPCDLVDSDKYVLNCGTLINSLEPGVHHMTAQILSILIDFTQTSVLFFRSFSKSLDLYNSGTRKDIKKR